MALQVFIKREGEKISLIVDGISAQSKRIPGDRIRLFGPLYVGGVPPSVTVNVQITDYTHRLGYLPAPELSRVLHVFSGPQAVASGGFVGCVRDLTLNKAPAGSPAHSQGTVPCFQDPLQPGAYFSGRGGHMTIGGYRHSSFVFFSCYALMS